MKSLNESISTITNTNLNTQSEKEYYASILRKLLLTLIFSTFFTTLLWSINPILIFLDLQPTDDLLLSILITSLIATLISFIFTFKSIKKHCKQLFYKTHLNQENYHKAKEMLMTKEKKLSALLEQAPIGIFYYNNNLKIIRHNAMFTKLFGLRENLQTFDLNSIQDSKAISILKHVVSTPSKKESIGSFNFSFSKKPIWVELTCASLLNDQNEIIGGIGAIEDKSTEHMAYEKINYISLHDALTSLPNRRSYQEYMEKLISKVEHTDSYSFLFYMDLNHFKQINDTFGHTVGDKLLLEVADRLKSLRIKNKYLSRIGGDEFITLVPFYTKDPIIAKGKAQDIALKIKALFTDAFQIEGLDLFMTTSIGIVLIEPNSNNTEQIIRQADMAMYQTKREGLNNIRFYDHSLDVEQQELTSLQHDLKDAIDNGELQLYYQPIVSITNNSLNAVEALVRWNHPTKGIIMPNKFLPMATESGLITKVGWWVAKEVCRQLSIWKEAKIINFEYISVNINTRQLNEVNFVEQLDSCIKKGGINPSLLKLELTETTLLDNFEKTQTIIQRLKANGVECSIDGFGTGYSSLSYLKKFAFKVLKIDKVFTQDILTNKDNQELVKSIIAIGQQFNYKVIIEGVETEQQREEIMNIDSTIYYQGFLCSKAIPAKEFERKFLTYVYHI